MAVLLQLGDKLIALLHDVLVLLVLVVGAVRLDDALARNTVDGAGDTAARDELCEITICGQLEFVYNHMGLGEKGHVPVQEINGDTEVVSHALQSDDAVALQ